MDVFFAISAQTYAKAVRAFADAGCRYLQLDEMIFAYLCDPRSSASSRAARRRSGQAAANYAEDDQRGDRRHPADMTITMHLCRGNFRSTFIGEGGYEPVAEMLFDTIKVHGYFMEYDTERAGGFEPLRFVPKGKTVVLGLVTIQDRHARSEGRAQAPHRRGGEIRRARPALPLAAMRLRLDRGRQHA